MNQYKYPIKLISSAWRVGKSVLNNLMIKEASGQFICWCDSDDTLDPKILDKAILILRQLPSFCDGLASPAKLESGEDIGNWTQVEDSAITQLANIYKRLDFGYYADDAKFFRSSI